jgi:hypothetical protein
MTSLRDQIAAFDDREVESVTVAEWGGMSFEMRAPSAGARMNVIRSAVGADGEPDLGKMQAAIIALCATDPADGSPIFTDDDFDMLNGKAAGPISDLFAVAQRLCGLTSDEVDAGKDD